MEQTWFLIAALAQILLWPQVARQATQIALDCHRPHNNMTLRHQHGPSWWPRLKTFAWPSVETRDTDINLVPLGCFRALDQDLSLGNNLGLDITLDCDDKHDTHVSLFLTVLISLGLPLTLAHEGLHLFLFHFSTLTSFTMMGPNHPGRLLIGMELLLLLLSSLRLGARNPR